MTLSVNQQRLLVHIAEQYPKSISGRAVEGVTKKTYASLENRGLIKRLDHHAWIGGAYQITVKGLLLLESSKLPVKLIRNGDLVIGVKVAKRKKPRFNYGQT